MPEDRRIAFGLVGTGASLIVLGASMLVCSRVNSLGPQQTFCRQAWPWLAGTGAAVGGVGLGLVAYTSSESDRANLGHASRANWTIGPTVTVSLP